MTDYTFPIKKDLSVPLIKNNKAFITYPAEHFALTYTIQPFPRQEYLNVHIEIVDRVTGIVVDTLNSFTITEQGFPTGIITNQSEIDSVRATHEQLSPLLSEAIASENQEEMDRLISEIAALPTVPTPIELYVNKYSEVSEYFDNKGRLTSEGFIWASNLSFLKDYL